MRNTLVLPENDPKWSAQALRHVIEDFTVILMLVFGTDGRATRAVQFADRLAERGRMPDGRSTRHVVWVRDPNDLAPVLNEMIGFPGESPLVVVLSFHDQVRGFFARSGPDPSPLQLEQAFLQGQG